MGSIVAIDGPAGAGKSTAARGLARRLGFRLLDTGAMYRAVALAASRRDFDWSRPESLPALARSLEITLLDDRVLLNGEDVSLAIRAPEITEMTRYAADNPGVREHLVELQRKAARDVDLVTEGRDQGTVVFPHADCKIFLTASPEHRARRRLEELRETDPSASLESVLASQAERDARDMNRPVGPLKRATDAIEFLTDQLSPDEVLDRLEALVRRQLEARRA